MTSFAQTVITRRTQKIYITCWYVRIESVVNFMCLHRAVESLQTCVHKVELILDETFTWGH